MRVEQVWRYPVKSMLGERLDAVTVGAAGVLGDRGYAVIDAADGKVASAKNPRKWRALLECRAAYLADPVADAVPPAVLITLPDGSEVRSDDGDADARLSAALGRAVHLAAAVPEGATFEETWPDVGGIAPSEFIDHTTVRHDEGEAVSDIALALAAPGTFFDLAPLHLLTTSSLEELARVAPGTTFAPERFRPNVVITGAPAGFAENGWVGAHVSLGAAAAAQVMMPTMRCVMTTLEQAGLPADRGVLRAAAEHNRIEITGLGEWACVGAYASVASTGAVRVGDEVTVDA